MSEKPLYEVSKEEVIIEVARDLIGLKWGGLLHNLALQESFGRDSDLPNRLYSLDRDRVRIADMMCHYEEWVDFLSRHPEKNDGSEIGHRFFSDLTKLICRVEARERVEETIASAPNNHREREFDFFGIC